MNLSRSDPRLFVLCAAGAAVAGVFLYLRSGQWIPPLLLPAMILATIVTVVVMLDGESTWPEVAALLALYFVTAAALMRG